MPVTDIQFSATAPVYTVAYQGAPGAYSEEMIATVWGDQATPYPSRTFEAVVDAVHSGTAHYGILPIENTIIGPITSALSVLGEAFAKRPGIERVDVIPLRIRHALLAPEGARIDGITQVTSHPVALAQCTKFLAARPTLSVLESYDTAGAAQDIAMRGTLHIAAIAGVRAAQLYNLQILAEEIQDMPNNETRFVVIANTGTDRW